MTKVRFQLLRLWEINHLTLFLEEALSFSLFKKPLQNGVKAGDMITLEISSKELFFRASQLYLMPLLALFVGASISNIFYPANDVIQTFVGLSSLSAVLLFLRHSLK